MTMRGAIGMIKKANPAKQGLFDKRTSGKLKIFRGES